MCMCVCVRAGHCEINIWRVAVGLWGAGLRSFEPRALTTAPRHHRAYTRFSLVCVCRRVCWSIENTRPPSSTVCICVCVYVCATITTSSPCNISKHQQYLITVLISIHVDKFCCPCVFLWVSSLLLSVCVHVLSISMRITRRRHLIYVGGFDDFVKKWINLSKKRLCASVYPLLVHLISIQHSTLYYLIPKTHPPKNCFTHG